MYIFSARALASYRRRPLSFYVRPQNHPMIRRRLLILIPLPIAALAMEPPITSESVEIKGIRIGLTRTEVSRLAPDWSKFTVAGVSQHPAFRDPTVYANNRLDRFVFVFYPHDFDAVLSALKEKYPQARCVTRVITDFGGTSAEQQECAVTDPRSVLLLRRYAADLQTSLIALYSRRFFAAEEKRLARQKKDI